MGLGKKLGQMNSTTSVQVDSAQAPIADRELYVFLGKI